MPQRPDGSYDYGMFDSANPYFQQQQAAEYQKQADRAASSVGKGAAEAMRKMQEPIKYNVPIVNGSSGSGGGWRSEIIPGIIFVVFLYVVYCAFSSIRH